MEIHDKPKELSNEIPSWEESIKILERLPDLSQENRIKALESLIHNSSPWIRQRTIRAGAAVLPEQQIVVYIRNGADDVLRNMGLEMLKSRGSAALSIGIKLLKDEDPDVVLQAILIVAHIKDPRALEPLRQLLRHENPNVVQAAILAIGQLGDKRVIPDIMVFLKADSWFQVAAMQALADLKSPSSLMPLKNLLTDMYLGSFAAEAIARIGGMKAYRILSDYWLQFHEQIDDEVTLGLLAHVLEGLSRKPNISMALYESILPYLDNESEASRIAAARCILSFGPGKADARALHTLMSVSQTDELPYPCLNHRPDLIHQLLHMQGRFRLWGFQLLERHPGSVSVETMAAVLNELKDEEINESLIRALQKMKNYHLAAPILHMYQQAPEHSRTLMIPLLKLHRMQVMKIIKTEEDSKPEIVTAIQALLGVTASKVARKILDFPIEKRLQVLSAITDQKKVLKLLPWKKWLEHEPSLYGPIASEIAMKSDFKELVPYLRKILKQLPDLEIMRALGRLQDRESIPILIDYYDKAEPFVRARIIEALGKIGGTEARKVLKLYISKTDSPESNFSYKALSECAVEDDLPVFRSAITHNDWVVRLACAEVLSRYPCPENLSMLACLLADPVAAVSKRAAALLESL